eukprot:8890930-Karenia_brevis.AAC.1
MTLIENETERKASERKRKASALDDVPFCIKRTRYQEDPAGVQQLPLVAMNATVHSQAKDWFDKYQLGGLSMLMNKV